MNNRRKFTDENYVSKEELKFLIPQSFNERKWLGESKYRYNFSFLLPLKFNDKEKLFIVQTPWILQKEIKMINDTAITQRKLFHSIGHKYNIVSMLKDIQNKIIVADIYYLLQRNKTLVSRHNIEKLINASSRPVDENEKKAVNLYRILRTIENKFNEPKEIQKLLESNGKLRKNDASDENIFNAFALIESYSETIEAINDPNIRSYVVKASILYFNIRKNLYFDKDNYLTTVFTMYSFLSQTFFKDILNIVPFFVLMESFKLKLNKAFDNVILNQGDLTYIYLVILNFLKTIIKFADEQIENFLEEKSELSDFSVREKNITTDKLMNIYCELSQRQALFFMAHNDKKMSYTISQFKKYTTSSYETSRYSMDNLVELGFYKKQKVGKKFVYKPTKTIQEVFSESQF